MGTRRRFILQLGALATGLGLMPAAALATARVSARPGGFTRRAWAARIGDWFLFFDPETGVTADLQLVAVTSGPRAPRLEQYSLMLRGLVDGPLREGLYEVSDVRGSSFPLFVSPAGEGDLGPLVRADCTRFI
jgi:hypothetical protein